MVLAASNRPPTRQALYVYNEAQVEAWGRVNATVSPTEGTHLGTHRYLGRAGHRLPESNLVVVYVLIISYIREHGLVIE